MRPIASGFGTAVDFQNYYISNQDSLLSLHGEDAQPSMKDLGVSMEAGDASQFSGTGQLEYGIMNAFDKNDETFWLDIIDKEGKDHQKDFSPWQLWIGLDLANAPNLNV